MESLNMQSIFEKHPIIEELNELVKKAEKEQERIEKDYRIKDKEKEISRSLKTEENLHKHLASLKRKMESPTIKESEKGKLQKDYDESEEKLKTIQNLIEKQKEELTDYYDKRDSELKEYIKYEFAKSKYYEEKKIEKPNPVKSTKPSAKAETKANPFGSGSKASQIQDAHPLLELNTDKLVKKENWFTYAEADQIPPYMKRNKTYETIVEYLAKYGFKYNDMPISMTEDVNTLGDCIEVRYNPFSVNESIADVIKKEFPSVYVQDKSHGDSDIWCKICLNQPNPYLEIKSTSNKFGKQIELKCKEMKKLGKSLEPEKFEEIAKKEMVAIMKDLPKKYEENRKEIADALYADLLSILRTSHIEKGNIDIEAFIKDSIVIDSEKPLQDLIDQIEGLLSKIDPKELLKHKALMINLGKGYLLKYENEVWTLSMKKGNDKQLIKTFTHA